MLYERSRTGTLNRPPISSTHNPINDYWDAESRRQPNTATLEQIREEFDPVTISMKRFATAVDDSAYGPPTKVLLDAQSVPVGASNIHTNPFSCHTGNRDKVSHDVPQMLQTQAESSAHYNYNRQVTTADDRSILAELISRQPPCASEHYIHVFHFFVSLIPLFHLHLVPDFILMQYLLPKVYGRIARVLLHAASSKGTFAQLCATIRAEYFCDRASIQLADQFFFKNFQTATQSAGEFIEFMQGTYDFLLIPVSECNAVTIIMENLLPDTLAAISGRPWPLTFAQLHGLTSQLNRQTVILEQRLQVASVPPTLSTSHHSLPSLQMKSDPPFPLSNPNLTFGPRPSPPRHPSTITSPHAIPRNNFSPHPPTCYNCGDPSHFRAQCPTLPRTNVRSSNNLDRGRSSCTYCGKAGHTWEHCFRRLKAQSGNEFSATQ